MEVTAFGVNEHMVGLLGLQNEMLLRDEGCVWVVFFNSSDSPLPPVELSIRSPSLF